MVLALSNLIDSVPSIHPTTYKMSVYFCVFFLPDSFAGFLVYYWSWVSYSKQLVQNIFFFFALLFLFSFFNPIFYYIHIFSYDNFPSFLAPCFRFFFFLVFFSSKTLCVAAEPKSSKKKKKKKKKRKNKKKETKSVKSPEIYLYI